MASPTPDTLPVSALAISSMSSSSSTATPPPKQAAPAPDDGIMQSSLPPVLLPLEIIHSHFSAPTSSAMPSPHLTPASAKGTSSPSLTSTPHSPPQRTSSPSFLSNLASLKSRATSALATRRQQSRYRKSQQAAHCSSVTPNLLMMTVPYSVTATEQQIRAQLDAARSHLTTHHDGSYLVIDVGVLRDAQCPDDYFIQSRIEYPSVVTLDVMVSICAAMQRWWAIDPSHIVLVACSPAQLHLIAACALFYSSQSAASSELKARKCCPSEKKFLADFAIGIQNDRHFPVPKLILTELIIHKLPRFDDSGCRLTIMIIQNGVFLYTTMQHGHGGGQLTIPTTDADPLTVSIPIGIAIRGEAQLKVSHIPEAANVNNSRQRVFDCKFHTGIAATTKMNYRLLIRKDDLDLPENADINNTPGMSTTPAHVKYHRNFRIEMVFKEAPPENEDKEEEEEEEEQVETASVTTRATPAPSTLLSLLSEHPSITIQHTTTTTHAITIRPTASQQLTTTSSPQLSPETASHLPHHLSTPPQQSFTHTPDSPTHIVSSHPHSHPHPHLHPSTASPIDITLSQMLMAPDEISHVLGQMREERKDTTATTTNTTTVPAPAAGTSPPVTEDTDLALARALQEQYDNEVISYPTSFHQRPTLTHAISLPIQPSSSTNTSSSSSSSHEHRRHRHRSRTSRREQAAVATAGLVAAGLIPPDRPSHSSSSSTSSSSSSTRAISPGTSSSSTLPSPSTSTTNATTALSASSSRRRRGLLSTWSFGRSSSNTASSSSSSTATAATSSSSSSSASPSTSTSSSTSTSTSTSASTSTTSPPLSDEELARQLHQQFLAEERRDNYRQLLRAQGDLDPDSMSYDALLDLNEYMGASRDRARRDGATREQIATLPIFRVVQDNHKILQEECQICRDTFVVGDTLRSLPCIHAYHAQCIDHWLRQNRSCPVCKVPAI